MMMLHTCNSTQVSAGRELVLSYVFLMFHKHITMTYFDLCSDLLRDVSNYMGQKYLISVL